MSHNIGQVTHAYMVAALFTTTEGPDSVELTTLVSLDDYAPEAVEAMQLDCERFIHAVFEDDTYELLTRNWNSSEIGHDLWLTRNRHGAGFWDRGLGAVGDRMTKIAQAMGEAMVELGDDGKVYYRV